MAVRYQIVSNNLKVGTFVARVLGGRRVELDAMIPNITAKTSLSASDVRGVITALTEELRATLAAGDTAVINGIATFRVSLSGSFTSPDQTITRDNAQLNITIQNDARLLTAVTNLASFERVIRDAKAPIVNSFYDIGSASFDQYTAGGIIRVLGDNLKFDQANPAEGVFLQNGDTETRLTMYSTVGERQIDALVPAGVTGDLTVIVRAQYTTNGDLREGRHRRIVHPA